MSLRFADGIADAVNLGDVATARFEHGVDWSFLSFFRVENTASDDRTIIAKWGGAGKQFQLRTDSGAFPQNVEIWHNNALRFSAGDAVINTWYVTAVTHDSAGNFLGYLVEMDGNYIADANPGVSVGDQADLTQNIAIGLQIDGFLIDEMDGDLAHACYVNAVITKQEITAFLANPAKMAKVFKAKYGSPFYLPLGLGSPEQDWSGNGNSGVRVNAPVVSEMPPTTLLTPKWASTFPANEEVTPPVSGANLPEYGQVRTAIGDGPVYGATILRS